ncbi:MAG: hypothetical protein WD847_13745 [Pirellulales bacterium]
MRFTWKSETLVWTACFGVVATSVGTPSVGWYRAERELETVREALRVEKLRYEELDRRHDQVLAAALEVSDFSNKQRKQTSALLDYIEGMEQMQRSRR